jgi:hypothetical protein
MNPIYVKAKPGDSLAVDCSWRTKRRPAATWVSGFSRNKLMTDEKAFFQGRSHGDSLQ